MSRITSTPNWRASLSKRIVFSGKSHTFILNRKSTPLESQSREFSQECNWGHASSLLCQPIILHGPEHIFLKQILLKSVKGIPSPNSFYSLTFISLFTIVFSCNQAYPPRTLATRWEFLFSHPFLPTKVWHIFQHCKQLAPPISPKLSWLELTFLFSAPFWIELKKKKIQSRLHHIVFVIWFYHPSNQFLRPRVSSLEYLLSPQWFWMHRWDIYATAR